MEFDPPLNAGRLLRRYKRFLADIVTADGESTTIHCPNPGAMTGCDVVGSRIWYSTSSNATRKYRHSLELVETEAGHCVGVNPSRANAVVGEALAAGRLEAFSGAAVRRETPIPDATGRFDFHACDCGGRDCYIEVKSVTLLRDDGIGAFPDAKSMRATRHVAALQRSCESGARAVLIFCVQHNGIECVVPADDIDPQYGAAVRRAHAAGVEVMAYRARVSPQRIELGETLPVRL
ncbi:MAG TPA: DNA/RNA nuclease SfsA [Pseudomonadales bacterium]|nr:DNA/RNA nuclease SfsA [Pseudomonadales bacterium]